jgi:hypothetical protein
MGTDDLEGWQIALVLALNVQLWAAIVIGLLVKSPKVGFALAFTIGILDNVAARIAADAWGNLQHIPLNGFLCAFLWAVTFWVMQARRRAGAPKAA